MLIEAHGIVENSFSRRARCVVRGRGGADDCRREWAAGCVSFLVKAMQLVLNTPSALPKNKGWHRLCFIGFGVFSLAA